MCSLPIYEEVLIRRLLVTHRTDPGRLLLIHLDIKCCIKALEVRAGYRSAWNRQPHLSQLEHTTNITPNDAQRNSTPTDSRLT